LRRCKTGKIERTKRTSKKNNERSASSYLCTCLTSCRVHFHLRATVQKQRASPHRPRCTQERCRELELRDWGKTMRCGGSCVTTNTSCHFDAADWCEIPRLIRSSCNVWKGRSATLGSLRTTRSTWFEDMAIPRGHCRLHPRRSSHHPGIHQNRYRDMSRVPLLVDLGEMRAAPPPRLH
jgi:hypothetical protein